MKKYLYLFLLIFTINSISSQGKSENISSKYRPGVMWFYTGIRPAIPEKVRKYDRLIIDVTYNDWFGKKNKLFKNKWNSIGFNSSIMFDIPLSKGNVVSFGVGLSYSLLKINHNSLFIRNEKEKNTYLYDDISNYGIKNSAFKQHSISLPLELRFRGKNWQHFKTHLGLKLSYNLLTNTVVSSKNKSFISKYSEFGFYDTNPINTSLYFRFGIRNWAFFAQLNFLPLFKNSSSVELKTLQWGLSISLF